MTAARRSASRRMSRRSRRSRGRGDRSVGRLIRGVLEFLLVVVLLLFAASLLGLLPSRGPQGEQASEQEWEPGPRVLPAVAPAGGEGYGEPGDRGMLRRSMPSRPPRATSTEQGTLEAGAPIRLHVANGCGVARLAAQMREALRGGGFDVLGISNADSDGYRETIVVQRSSDRRQGEAVIAFLRERWGVGRLILQERPSPAVDVLLILGQDLADALEGAAGPHSAR